MKTILMVIAMAITVLMVGCNNYQAETAKEQKTETVFPKGNKITSENFTGTAWLHMMIDNDSTLHVKMGNVTFEPKARTNWHSHPGGQILIITYGQGYYQASGKPAQVLQKGDVVEIPPNTEHWHGAGPESEFAHIAISLNTNKGGVVWLQPVTDEEYNNTEQ